MQKVFEPITLSLTKFYTHTETLAATSGIPKEYLLRIHKKTLDCFYERNAKKDALLKHLLEIDISEPLTDIYGHPSDKHLFNEMEEAFLEKALAKVTDNYNSHLEMLKNNNARYALNEKKLTTSQLEDYIITQYELEIWSGLNDSWAEYDSYRSGKCDELFKNLTHEGKYGAVSKIHSAVAKHLDKDFNTDSH